LNVFRPRLNCITFAFIVLYLKNILTSGHGLP
jgi:hypothetical protein